MNSKLHSFEISKKQFSNNDLQDKIMTIKMMTFHIASKEKLGR